MAHLPLKGIKIIEVANNLAGPGSCSILGDFGARIIKVEHPKKGDTVRAMPLLKNDVSLFFKTIGRNKECITLDLKAEESKEIIHDLVKDADVLIESFRPGVMERYGLGYEVLKSYNPRLIMARLSAYGQKGPYNHKPGFATIADAFSGFAIQQRYADREPLLAPYGYSDWIAGIVGACAIMVALHERDHHSGEGQEIDLTIYQGPFSFVGPHVSWYDQLGVKPKRMGNRVPSAAPRNLYKTKDKKWCVIACSTPVMWERICTSMGRPELITDEHYKDSVSRVDNVDAVDEIMNDWISQLTLAEALEILEGNDVACGPVMDVEDIMNDPHYKARGDIVEVEDEDLGTIKMQNVLFGLSRTPGKVRFTPGAMGSCNEKIYSALGYSKEKITVLKAKGVI